MKNTLLYASGHRLLIDSKVKTFESRPGTTNYRLTFVFKNASNRPIRLFGSHSSCFCSAAKSIPTIVEAESTKPVEVLVSPVGKRGPFDETVTIYTDDAQDSVIVLRVRGQDSSPRTSR